MEEMTKEEVKSYKKVIEKLSKPTGNTFFDTMTDSKKAECKKLNYVNHH